MGCTSGNVKRTGRADLRRVLERGSLTDPGKQWESVPDDCLDKLSTAGITGVFVNPNESVKWTYRHNPDGTRTVIGYRILEVEG